MFRNAFKSIFPKIILFLILFILCIMITELFYRETTFLKVQSNVTRWQIFYDTGSGYSQNNSMYFKTIAALPLRQMFSLRLDPGITESGQCEISEIFIRSGLITVKYTGKQLFERIQGLNHIRQKHFNTKKQAVILKISGEDPHFQFLYGISRWSVIFQYLIITGLVFFSFVMLFRSFLGRYESGLPMVKESTTKKIMKLATAFCGILVLFFIIRWFYFIDQYSVNVLFWDHWDFYEPFFRDTSFRELFRWQHGPHRQGLGFIFTYMIDSVSGWNTRVITFFAGFLAICSGILSLKVIQQIKKIDIFDVLAMAALFLSLQQWALFVNTPNLSHGPVTLLILFSMILLVTRKRTLLNMSLILLLNFCIIYTGFGMFMGIITIVWLFFEMIVYMKFKNYQMRLLYSVALVIAVASFLSFFAGYHESTANPNFTFPISEPWRYLYFVAVNLSSFFGIRSVPLGMTAGFILFGLLDWILIHHLLMIYRKNIKNNQEGECMYSKVIIILIAFSLLFSLGAGIGRISGGVKAAFASRYVIYLVPAFVGMYLHLIFSEKQYLRFVFIIFSVLFISWLHEKDTKRINWLYNGKKEWVKAYKKTSNISKANQISSFAIYPAPEETKLKKKLEYLKSNKLNFFKVDNSKQ